MSLRRFYLLFSFLVCTIPFLSSAASDSYRYDDEGGSTQLGLSFASDTEDPEIEVNSSRSKAGAVIAPHIGVLVPQLFNELGSWPIFGLELGYLLPIDIGPFIQPLQITLDTQYTAPWATGSGFNPNLGTEGADYSWNMKERMLSIELSGLWRFMPPGEVINAYAILGPRLYLMESVLNASSGEFSFGENRETKTHIGLVVGGGADFRVGPGSIFGTLRFGWSKLDKRITGEANTGAFGLSAGYRFHF